MESQKNNRQDGSKECHSLHYKNIVHLWEFLMELLADDRCTSLISWSRKEYGEFKLKDQEEVARRWGKVKKRPGMNYEKLSRALRYYYRQGIIKKVPGQKLVYKFDKLPYEYKPRIVNIRHAKQTQRQPCSSRNDNSPQSSSSMSARRDSAPIPLSSSSMFPPFFQDSIQLPTIPFLVNSPCLSDYYQSKFLYNSRTPFQSWLEVAKAESSNDMTFPKSAPPSITTVKVPFSFSPSGNKHSPLPFSKLKLAKQRSIPVSVITKNTSQ